MISLLTSVAPIALGFVGKLFAMKQHANADQQKLMIGALQAQNNSINQARDMAAKESPFAAMNRRIIILVILGLLVAIQFAPVAGLDTVIPTVKEGFTILGIKGKQVALFLEEKEIERPMVTLISGTLPARKRRDNGDRLNAPKK